MLADWILRAYHGQRCPFCGADLTYARLEGLGVREAQVGEMGLNRAQPVVLVRCRRCGQKMMMMAQADSLEVMMGVASMCEYLKTPRGQPRIQHSNAPARGTSPEGKVSPMRPSRRPRHPTGPITQAEALRFLRKLETISFKRKSKGFQRFLEKLEPDIDSD